MYVSVSLSYYVHAYICLSVFFFIIFNNKSLQIQIFSHAGYQTIFNIGKYVILRLLHNEFEGILLVVSIKLYGLSVIHKKKITNDFY